jgi:hypothetical protein
MSKEDRERGARDAEHDKYSPPRHSILVPESEETYHAVEDRKNDYDEGWAEAKLAMNAADEGRNVPSIRDLDTRGVDDEENG